MSINIEHHLERLVEHVSNLREQIAELEAKQPPEPRSVNSEMLALCIQIRDWLKPELTKEPDRSFFWKLVDVINKAKPAVETVASKRCICGRSENFHPWRFCDKFQPTTETEASK